jgi:hypothetical protein
MHFMLRADASLMFPSDQLRVVSAKAQWHK